VLTVYAVRANMDPIVYPLVVVGLGMFIFLVAMADIVIDIYFLSPRRT
jgi:hypothetical protein